MRGAPYGAPGGGFFLKTFKLAREVCRRRFFLGGGGFLLVFNMIFRYLLFLKQSLTFFLGNLRILIATGGPECFYSHLSTGIKFAPSFGVEFSIIRTRERIPRQKITQNQGFKHIFHENNEFSMILLFRNQDDVFSHNRMMCFDHRVIGF